MEQGARHAQTLFYNLLGDPKRRLAILLHWHAHIGECKTTLRELWTNFVSTLLYKPVDVVIDNSGLYLFGTKQDMFYVAFEWLTAHEQQMVYNMVTNRKAYFKKEPKRYQSNRIEMVGFAHNKAVLTERMRIQLVRDFCSLVYEMVPQLRLLLFIVLNNVAFERGEPTLIVLAQSLIGQQPEKPSMTPVV